MDILHSARKLVRHAIFMVISLPHLCENLLVQETHDCEKRTQALPKVHNFKPKSVIKFQNFENKQQYG